MNALDKVKKIRRTGEDSSSSNKNQTLSSGMNPESNQQMSNASAEKNT
jgi:hypothetical protein